MSPRFVMVGVVIGLLLVPGFAGAINPNVYEVYEVPGGTTTCQACEVTCFFGCVVITYKCIASVGSGRSGCYTHAGAGCGFTYNYCVDVWGSLADGIQRDRGDAFVGDSTDLIANRF